jgi:hypothetical protein
MQQNPFRIIVIAAAISFSACTLPMEEDAELVDDGLVDEAESPVTATGLTVVTDIVLVASNSSNIPPGPSGYQRIGYWDMDDAGGVGTNNNWGEWNMAMYARKKDIAFTSTCVEAVFLYASDAGEVPESFSPGLTRIGYWDVDDGGAEGGNGSTGEYMAGLYIRKNSISNGECILDLALRATDGSAPACYEGYDCTGWWDIDDGGGVGNVGGWGEWMMGLATLSQ